MEETNALKWLEDLIEIRINPAKTNVNQLSEHQIKTMLQTFELKKHILQNHLRSLARHPTHSARQRVKQSRIDQTLRALNKAAYEHYQSPAIVSDPAKTLFLAITEGIGELIIFLDLNGKSPVDIDQIIPIQYLEECRALLSARISGIQPVLMATVSDSGLLALILDSFHDLTLNRPLPYTFRDLHYRKALVNSLDTLIRQPGQPRLDQQVIALLVYYNFNKKTFASYYTALIANNMQAAGSESARFELLLFEYKNFKQLPKKTGIRLTPTSPDLKKMIGRWFSHEISYLKNKTRWIIPAGHPTIPADDNSSIDPKIKLDMSVDQIAVLIRVLLDCGVVRNVSTSELCRQISRWIKTEKAEHISADSLRRKVSSPEDRDKQQVLAILEKLCASLKQF
ncbi:hypothetical protein SAMN04487995_0364 [Dyadobacter koreensis]|uniref:Uncharacterized protein n=1 Tax=Dyadobacter koreensis TaxID=408657 RepID=A0A1H6QCF6_9BACT|nr:hypothetical protein [Dyadobacter koreensis]SEI39536.1 hypothetical protein SAMN04487995_0364 [Dyadobacter koreensis]